MKRSLMVVCLALLFVSATAQAQTMKQAPPADQAQNLAQETKDFEAMRAFPYTKPGEKPVVLKSELVCAFGNIRLLTETQVAGLWDGDYDGKCTGKGLIPISQRLTNSFYLLLGAKDEEALRQVKTYLHQANFEMQDYLPAQKMDGKWVPQSPQPQLPLTYSTRPAGSITKYPPIPIGFALHTILIDGMRINYGPNAGRGIRLAVIRGFTMDDGTVEQPCLNFTGEFGEVTEATAPIPGEAIPETTESKTVVASPPAAGPIATAVANVNVELHTDNQEKTHVEKKKSHKGLIWGLIIGGAAVGAVCLLAHQHDSIERRPPDQVKTPVPPVSRP